jgi:lipopolysaccharide biosynthesis glycosyltransferase
MQNDPQQVQPEKRHLQVLLCPDRNVAAGAGTAIVSLLKNAADIVSFTFYIVSSETECEALKKILLPRFERMKGYGRFEIRFVPIESDELFQEIKPRLYALEKKINRNLSVATFYRLIAFGMNCYKEDLVIYLDADVLNTENIGLLLDSIDEVTPDKNEIVMAVSDRKDQNDYAVSALGMKGEGYFNAGVMVVDTAKWRAGDLSRKAFDFLFERQPKQADQDALNVVTEGRVRWLDNPFNSIIHAKNPEEKLKEGIVFYHFSGADKPWKPWLDPADPKVALYRSYMLILEPDESKWWDLSGKGEALWRPSSIHDFKLTARMMLKKGRVLSFLRWRLKQIRMKARRLGFWRTLLGF